MAESEIYTLGEWCGYRQYRCRFCPFDLLDDGTHDPAAEMYEHWLHQHGPGPELPPAPTPPGGTVLVADKSGREVAPLMGGEKPKRSRRMMEVIDNGDSDPDRAEPDREISGDATDSQLG